ncbi:unnamed protein product [Rodentolepis nana]|uniref:Mannosyl-glycoprotein endo-beta-N-acetylglucosaminidase n=1 Tax=Rodentolepis nana TaxID=102285 RepID=A0A0R3T1N8_RODNA|nr:unnamed protein product [Rodentolepis nana]
MICSPIKSFSELLIWKPKRARVQPSELVTPTIVFCHDMAGGYHDYDTTDKSVPTFPTYRFVHWDLIDTFIYFSHHFVTIPPVSWIDIAHKNGVRVYGTVIIECDRVNPCPQFDQIFGTTTKEVGLNDIRLHYRFEGWLINFENRRIFQRVLHFLKCLKSLGSEVIWYDAVTHNGHLNWQNSLTTENSAFFHADLDGIFLNYNWDPELLEFTQNHSDESMKIFVGVDCFGRNCPGGGGFARPDRPLSVALFAPAWPFEKRQISELIPQIRAIGNSFHTNFSLGLGLLKRNVFSPWSRLAEQQVSFSFNLPPIGSYFAFTNFLPNFMDCFTSGNSLSIDISPNSDQLLENFNLELFLFPNLSLSKNATLSMIIHFAGNAADVCVFAHVSTIPWESVNTAREYPVTGERILKHSGKEMFF